MSGNMQLVLFLFFFAMEDHLNGGNGYCSSDVGAVPELGESRSMPDAWSLMPY